MFKVKFTRTYFLDVGEKLIQEPFVPYRYFPWILFCKFCDCFIAGRSDDRYQ